MIKELIIDFIEAMTPGDTATITASGSVAVAIQYINSFLGVAIGVLMLIFAYYRARKSNIQKKEAQLDLEKKIMELEDLKKRRRTDKK